MKYRYRVISDGSTLEIETNRRPEIRENRNGGFSVIFLDVDNTLLGYYSQAQSVYLVNEERSDKTDLDGYLHYWKNFDSLTKPAEALPASDDDLGDYYLQYWKNYGVEPNEKDIQHGEILLVHFRNNGVSRYSDFQKAEGMILDWRITNHSRDIMGVLYRPGCYYRRRAKSFRRHSQISFHQFQFRDV